MINLTPSFFSFFIKAQYYIYLLFPDITSNFSTYQTLLAFFHRLMHCTSNLFCGMKTPDGARTFGTNKSDLISSGSARCWISQWLLRELANGRIKKLWNALNFVQDVIQG